ncbi:MAG: DUF389 domain-containing protein [Oscillospiraceae bacterium]
MNTVSESPVLSRKESVKQYFRSLLDIRGDMMSYEEIDEMMQENTVIRGSNMWILMLAILIASIGLNVNSTAVIIGAMLISPLMSGIMTMGYSLAVRDLTLLKHSLTRFATQVVISLAASTMYFFISPLDEPTTEMIARTSPTLWDVLIALFGGIAGMIGNTRKKKGNVIPGVAIATALMPPLCTAGYGIATLQPRFILGAFYLFLINTLFITLSSSLVTLLLKVPYHRNISQSGQKKINRIIALITVIAVIPSVFVGAVTVYNSYIDHSISSYLDKEFRFPDTQVVQSSTDTNKKLITVSLVGAHISDDTIAALEKELDEYGLENYSLRITQNYLPDLSEADNTDKVTIAVQENQMSEMQSQLNEKQQRIDELEKLTSDYEAEQQSRVDCALLAKNAEQVFSDLEDCSCGIMSDAEGEYVLLTARSKEKLSDKETVIIENWLKNETGMVRAVIIISK